jgi:hypothetical protein
MTMGTAVSWQLAARQLPHHRASVSLQRLEPHLDDARWAARVSAAATSPPRRSMTRLPTKGVTHFGGAPIVLNMIVNAEDARAPAPSIISSRSLPPAPRRRRDAGRRSSRWAFQRDAGLRAHRNLWPCDRMPLAGGPLGRSGSPMTRPLCHQGAQGVAMPMMEEITRHGRGDGQMCRWTAPPGRDHDPRQFGDEGLPEEPRGDHRGLPRAGISIPATSP